MDTSQPIFDRVLIPKELHGFVCGPDGQNIKRWMQEYDVMIQAPVPTDQRSHILVAGQEDQVQKTTEAIKKVTQDKKRMYQLILGEMSTPAEYSDLVEEDVDYFDVDHGAKGSEVQFSQDICEQRPKDKLEEALAMLKKTDTVELALERRHQKFIKKRAVNRLKATTGVSIKIPSPGDSDSILIMGPTAGVVKAKRAMLEIIDKIIGNNHTAEVHIPKYIHGHIIGKGGMAIKKLRDETNTVVTIPGRNSESDVITITGKKADVEQTKRRLVNIQKEISGISTTQTVPVPLRFRQIIIDSYQQKLSLKYNVNVIAPPGLDFVTMTGRLADVASAEKDLEEFCQKQQVVEERKKEYVDGLLMLHSENPFLHSSQDDSGSCPPLSHCMVSPEDRVNTEELLKQIRKIMNKVTMHKMKKYTKEVGKLRYGSQENLEIAVNYIHKRAVEEPCLGETYAKLCLVFSTVNAHTPDSEEPSTFKRILLDLCQKTLGMSQTDDVTLPEEEPQERTISDAHRKTTGNTRFIAELFKAKVITKSQIHNCLRRLCSSDHETDIECICHLLTRTGRELDYKRDRGRLDVYFDKLHTFLNNDETSPRVRLLIQDAIRIRKGSQGDEDVTPCPLQPIIGETGARLKDPGSILSTNQTEEEIDRNDAVKAGLKTLSQSSIKMKTDTLLEDYLIGDDIQEAVRVVRFFHSDPSVHLFVLYSINKAIERSEIAREKVALLLSRVVKENVITYQHYIKGLDEFLKNIEELEELAVDVPYIWRYLGDLLGNMVYDSTVPLVSLRELLRRLKKCSKGGDVMAFILHKVARKTDTKTMTELWKSSGLMWIELLPLGENIEAFVREKNLGMTLEGGSSIPMDKVSANLNTLIVDRAVENENIFDWIDVSVSDSRTKGAAFIQALVSSVCKSVIKEEDGFCMLDDIKIQKRSKLLRRYLQQKQERELKALYTVQEMLCTPKYPPGLLQQFFDVFYDEHVISENAFLQWRSNQDAGEGSVKYVEQFYTWLQEA